MLPFIQATGRRAAEIYDACGAKERVEREGYTRVDPFWVAARSNVTVMLRPMDKLLGAFIREESAGILINSQRTAGVIHMTCAHELGHYFMGHGTTADAGLDYGPKGSRMEQEADWFAYQLMAPRLLLANVLKRKNWSIESLKSPVHLYQLSLRLGLSYAATAWSLHRQRLMDRVTTERMLRVEPGTIKRALVGNESFDPHREVWLVNEDDRASVLEPHAEDKILLRLRSHASAGYQWTVDDMAQKGFQLMPVVQLADIPPPLDDTVFGAPTTADYVLAHPTDAGAADSAPIKVLAGERRPWLVSEPVYARFETIAKFEGLSKGLTGAAKAQLLHEAADA